MLRYIRRLEAQDLSLTTSMIPLGSCTMKLNATAEMLPDHVAGVRDLHPFAPREQTRGLLDAFRATWRRGWPRSRALPRVSLQPNAGSQGEYAGLLVIRGYHEARGEGRTRTSVSSRSRRTAPIRRAPSMAGLQVVVVKTATRRATSISPICGPRRRSMATDLAALMVTYPSTHGVFEESIREVVRNRPRGRRAGLSGWREHERTWSGCAGRAISAPMSATSTCTRPSASRMAAAAREWGRSPSRPISRRSFPAIRSPMSAAGSRPSGAVSRRARGVARASSPIS